WWRGSRSVMSGSGATASVGSPAPGRSGQVRSVSADSVTDPVSADLDQNPPSADSAAGPLSACSGQVSSLSGRGSVALFCSQENSSAGVGSAASGMLVITASNGPRSPWLTVWFPLTVLTPGSGVASQPWVAAQPPGPLPESADGPSSGLSRPTELVVGAE